MPIISLPIHSDEHWRTLRREHVGASEVAALFSISPWVTRWQLYHLKRGTLPDVIETSAMTQGRHFEPAVASYAQDKFGITLRKVRRYLSDPETKLGSTLDYEEIGGGSLIPTELKFSLWGGDWEYEGEELTQIPDYYMMQVQSQLACCPAAPHGQLIAFTGGDLKRMIIPRSDRLITAIKAAVWQFWEDVRTAKEPPVDFSADADAVTRLAYLSKLRSLVITPDRAPLFETWAKANAAEKAAKAESQAARAEVLKMVIDAGEGPDTAVVVTCGDYRIALSKIADNPGKEITPDMVGTRVGTRDGYLRAALSNVVEKAAAKAKK